MLQTTCRKNHVNTLSVFESKQNQLFCYQYGYAGQSALVKKDSAWRQLEIIAQSQSGDADAIGLVLGMVKFRDYLILFRHEKPVRIICNVRQRDIQAISIFPMVDTVW